MLNIQALDILKLLSGSKFINQRQIAEASNYSLGTVNSAIKKLLDDGLIDDDMKLTTKGIKIISSNKPTGAIILAAGYGMRMVPINTQISKGLIEVNGETLIERLINQLHESGITDITVVAGFMMEKYEFLIDKYGVDIVVNEQYSVKNNLHSLSLVEEKIGNTYIVPCDIWCAENPFNSVEAYSWYMVSNEIVNDSSYRVNRKKELVLTGEKIPGNRAIGIAYINKTDAKGVRESLRECNKNPRFNNSFWENAITLKNSLSIPARVVTGSKYIEINTFEQFRDFVGKSWQLESSAIDTICSALNVTPDEITDITVQKKGMTNRSFLFAVDGCKYIMRIPGEGTDKLISRKKEAAVYEAIKAYGICDNVVYINPENGYKITEYIKDAKVCDPLSDSDVRKAMKKLKEFHNLKIEVSHEFNIFEQIEFYESLWGDTPSVYEDYQETKANVLKLKKYIGSIPAEKCLTHIDAVPDNFIFVDDDVRLIDWEYSGMQDPLVDIAMFSIYSLYSKDQIDNLISIYFDGDVPETVKTRIYAYVSCCGLLWSNWCEYKRQLGIEFGAYSLKQYRYAKEFYRIVKEEIS